MHLLNNNISNEVRLFYHGSINFHIPFNIEHKINLNLKFSLIRVVTTLHFLKIKTYESKRLQSN